ncbi:radical SAM protein [Planctomycetota bacterium]
MVTYRDYTYLGLTQSLCPECLAVIPAKIIERGGRIYFRKRCKTHGDREDYICSDAKWFDRIDYSLPGKVPASFGASVDRGCPYDCGLCAEHEQHTCIGLIEITSSCNLDCPMCFAESGPGGKHWSLQQCKAAIDRLVEVEGQPEVLQISGGEPTIHPEFDAIFEYACSQPIDIVMINTNGVRLARDRAFLERVAKHRKRTEIYLQFDGLDEKCYTELRGESLLETKLQAIERLGEVGLNTILVSTVQPDVNDDQYGQIVDFGLERSWITGASFQPATYTGRYVLPEDLHRRTTFPDVIKGIVSQTTSDWRESDFAPLPCAHPNGHTLAFAVRSGELVVPLARFVELKNHLDLLAGRITFDRQRARELIDTYLSRQPCCHGGCDIPDSAPKLPTTFDDLSESETNVALDFFTRALAEDLDPCDMFRITTTTFMDAYNFDVRQLMKSCVHFILPTGHVIPFSAYNVLYRNGHVPLPPLTMPMPESVPA